VSRLWLGPIYIESLIAGEQSAAAAGDIEKAKAKRARATEHLVCYQELVAGCQSALFKGEADRIAALLANA
jgi:hypothetical protein